MNLFSFRSGTAALLGASAALALTGSCGGPAVAVEAPQEDVMAVEAERPPPKSLAQKRLDHLARMKGAIRLHAAADYAQHCGIIELPDAAFIPIELNGGGLPELAVAFGRAYCSGMGATGFSSTGGSLVQFWHASEDGPVRMLTEGHMLGFTPSRLELVTMQHGGHCGLPGAAGCLITYRWATPMFGDMKVERRRGDQGPRVKLAYDRLEGAPGVISDRKRDKAEQLARMRAAIRQDALLNYGEECGPVSLPDHAFNEVEISGDDFPELAVSLARAHCPVNAARFEGTGGPVVQIWHMARDHEGRDGPIRLLLESAMHGFTPAPGRLVTIQHGVRCPGGAGPDVCRITYVWDERAHHLDAVERRFRPPERLTRMSYGRERLSWTPR